MKAGSKPGVRTSEVIPTRSAAITIDLTSPRVHRAVLESMNAASNPARPMISTICGSANTPT